MLLVSFSVMVAFVSCLMFLGCEEERGVADSSSFHPK